MRRGMLAFPTVFYPAMRALTHIGRFFSGLKFAFGDMKRLSTFWALNTLFAGLISLNYFRQLGTEFSPSSGIYCAVTTIGHYASVAAIGWAAFAFLPKLIGLRKIIVARVLSIAAAFAGTVILLADTIVYGIYRYHIYNEFVLDLIFSRDAGGIFVFSVLQYLIMVALIIVLFAAQIGLFWVAGKITPFIGRKIAGTIIGVFAICFVTSNFMHAYFSAVGGSRLAEIESAEPVYYPLSANGFLTKHGFVSPGKIRQRVRIRRGSSLNYPRHPLVPETEPTKNVLIILIDSWNSNTVSPEIMPNLYKFSEGAQVFKNHFSGDHGTRTGVPSLFHGLPGLYWNVILDEAIPPAFIDVMVKADYDFGIFATAGLSSPPFDRTIFLNISDKLHSNFPNDVALTDAWLEWINNWQKEPSDSEGNPEQSKKFFGVIFYDMLHNMDLPKDAEKKFEPTWENARYELLGKNTDPTPFWNLYCNDALFLDQQIGRVLNDLRDRGLLENTIVVITGDHGQEFNETKKNFWGHGSAFTEPQLHVPLIVFDASMPPKTFEHWTAHYDVSVSILQNYLNVKNPASDYSVGKNLFDETPREWLLVGHPERFCVIEKDKITSVDYDKSYDVYDRNYNMLSEDEFNAQVFQAALKQATEFYKK